MNTLVANGFIEEMEKVGMPIPPTVLRVGIPATIGAALAAVSIADYFKSRKLDPKITPEFITGTPDNQVTSRTAIKDLLEKRPLIRPVVTVTTGVGVEKMVADPKFGFLTKRILKPLAEGIVDKADNAAVIQGEDKDYVIIPTKANPRVVEHEVGHLQDFARKIEESPGIIQRLLGLVWKPTYDKQVMDRERRAWTYAEKTPMREQALKSYERGFHQLRSGLTRSAAAVAFMNALRNLPVGGM